MPILRSLTTKIKTAISPSSSPTSPPPSGGGFEVLRGRREGSAAKRPESSLRVDSFMADETAATAAAAAAAAHMKQKRVSRFREELAFEHDE
ncbi:hypothetical protein ACEQ8H_000945 [Pleosporales sp. CAS-2024a]